MRLVNWRTLIAGTASIALAACGDDVTVVQPIPGLTLNPASVSCTAGTATAVGVTVSGATGTPVVTFTGSGTGFTVTGSGTGATVACTTAGSGVINVSVTANGQTVTGSIPVTVNAAQPPILAVSVSPNQAAIAVGGTVTLTPTVIAATTGANTAVTFTSLQTNIATVDANGVVRGVAPGIATVRVASVASPNIVAVATITVQATSAFIQSLTVQPSNVTLQTGSTQTLASTVTLAPGAPAGTSTGVTYTSSDTSVARVSSTGVITAVRNGTAVITVASTTAPSVTQSVSVTVRDPAPVRLTIQSTRIVNAVGNLVPADLNNVGGNLFVTLNLDPGDFRPDSVRLRLGSQTVNCQRFTAALAAAYREALTTGAADVQSIECQLNTAQFDAITGIAAVQNGAQPLTAEVFFRPQGAAAGTQTQRADIPLQLTVNNVSGFIVNVTNTPNAAQRAVNATGLATGPQGVLWRAGAINVTVLPVNFTPVQNPGTQTFTITLQDANGVVATQTASQATAGAAAFTAVFPGDDADARPAPNNSVTGYTTPNAGQAPGFAGAFTGGGTFVVVGTAAGTGNTNILNAAGMPAGFQTAPGTFLNAVAQPIYIDNQRPEDVAQFVGPNFVIGAGGTSGFINGTFAFADGVQQAPFAVPANLGDNNGVDRMTRQFFFAPNTPGLTPADIVSGGTAVTNGGQINQNISATAYVAAVRLIDALGNGRTQAVRAGSAAGAPFTFGVITATPTVAITTAGTNVGASARIGLAQGATARTIAFSATSTSGASFPTNFIVGTLQVTRPNGSVFCATTADVAGSTLTGANAGVAAGQGTPCPRLEFNTVSIDPTTAQTGIYVITYQSRDIAGNLSASATRTFVIDRVAPVIVNPLVSTPPLTGGSAETFQATASDDFGLIDQIMLQTFPSGTEVVLRYDATTLGTAFAAPFTRNATLTVSDPLFVRGIALQPQSGANTFANVANNGIASSGAIAIGASDPGANWGYGVISAAAVTSTLDQTQPTPTFFGGTGPQNVSLTFQASGASSATTGGFAAALAPATTGTPTSQTINLVQNGIANTPFVNAFNRVQLFLRATIPGNAQGVNPFGVTTAYRLISDCSASSVSISTTASTITNSCSVVPGSGSIPAFPSSGTTAVDLLLLATDANGYAAAFIIPTITLNP